MRYAAAALLAALLTAGCGAAPATRSTPQPEPLVVTGYALDDLPDATVARDADALAEVGVDGVTVGEQGAWTTAPSAGARRLVATAHEHGLRAELLVSNYSDRLGDFSPAVASRLLRDAPHRRQVADRLAGFVRDQGWDGVTVDLESLRRGDAAGLVTFVRALRARLPEGARISVDLMASTTTADYAAGGYDLVRLGRNVDVVALMAYDQHGPTWSGPGPIGALPWVRRSATALLAGVPAAKVDLGVAGYGYSWPRRGTGRDLTVAQARRLVSDDGATAAYDERAGEWTATLSDGTVLWWSDARSYAARADLARELGLHGLALWRLGSADPLGADPLGADPLGADPLGADPLSSG